jgi:hypothetical protein
VYAEGARFILDRAERPYFQSSVACATGTIDDQTRSRGYNDREREERLPSLFIRVEVEFRSYRVVS